MAGWSVGIWRIPRELEELQAHILVPCSNSSSMFGHYQEHCIAEQGRINDQQAQTRIVRRAASAQDLGESKPQRKREKKKNPGAGWLAGCCE